MGSPKLGLLALFVGVVALAVALTGAFRGTQAAGRVRGAVSAGSPELALRIAELEGRLHEFEGELDALRLQPATPPAPARAPTAADRSGGEQGARLAELEGRIDRLEQGSDTRIRIESLMAGKDRDERDRPTVDESIAAVNDPSSTPEEMLSGLGRLRGARLEDGTDARILVLDAAIDLALTSEDPRVRADVWRQLDGVTDPSLHGVLLDAVSRDPASRVREEAAESLAPFLPDPTTEAVLLDAMENDEDEGVRRQAGESLAVRKP